MKKINVLFIWALIIIIIGLVGYYFIFGPKVEYRYNDRILTDTIYINKPFTPNSSYNNHLNENQITIYKRDTIILDSVILSNDTITLVVHDTIYSKLSSNYLTLFPYAEKLIQLDLTSSKLDLSLLSTGGLTYTKTYNLELDKNNYRYVNGQMSFKRKYDFSINASYYIRPVVNYHDLNLLIFLKTGNFNYIGGINFYYYPNLKTSMGVTPIIGLNYKF